VLQPDIVLLDIGLPNLNGIEAAWHITRVAPAAKILFLSQESSAEIVQAAIEAGGHGYVVKTDAPVSRSDNGRRKYFGSRFGAYFRADGPLCGSGAISHFRHHSSPVAFDVSSNSRILSRAL
jgi:hypothetical protein